MIEEGVYWMLFYMFIGSTGMAAMFGILLALFLLTTPCRTFLRAKLKHRPIIASRRRDKKIDFHMADKYVEGLAVSKKYKSAYIIDPESVFTDSKSGAAILPVNSEIGITLTDDILANMTALKDAGIQNINDAEMRSRLWGICTCGFKGLMSPIVDKGVLMGLVCPQKTKKGEHIVTETDMEIVAPKKTFNYSAITRYFKNNLGAGLIMATLERMVSDAREDMDKGPWKLAISLIAVGIMIFMILIGTYILLTGIGGNIPAVTPPETLFG